MKVSRRNILKLLPAAPLAVRQAQQQAEQLLNASISTSIHDEESLHSFGGPEGRGSSLLKLFKGLGGVPEWKKRDLRRYARSSRRLDPDIAAMQSVSTSGKLAIQWRRNEQQANDKYLKTILDDEERSEFLRKHGLDWL